MFRDILNLIEKLPVEAEAAKEELTRSHEVLKKLLPFLYKRDIPVTPKNFRLFYDYLVFANPNLNRVLSESLDKGVKFHGQVSDRLYAYFYAKDQGDRQADAVNKAADAFIDVSRKMAQSITNMRGQQDHFHTVLSKSTRQFAEMEPEGPLQPCLEDLLAETRQALAATEAFASGLEEADEVIESLKKELEVQTDLARRDDLTGLSNRRHLQQEAPRLIREALEKEQPLSAIVFDLDFFKKVNDTWGHAQGDKVLVTFADIIKKAARRSDLAVRLGGEEFLLLCPNLGLAAAVKVADRVRESIASTAVPIEGKSQTITVRTSGGVAEYLPGEEIADLTARADAALYQAKAAGRNRIHALETSEDI